MKAIHINKTVPKAMEGDVVFTTRPIRGTQYSIIPANHRCVVDKVLAEPRYQYLLAWQGSAPVWAEDADINKPGTP